MLVNDPSGYGTPPSNADVVIKEDKEFSADGFRFSYLHFPGHTPGCSAILIKDSLFSGDFIFNNSIGRVDFPFSSPDDMKESIHKFLHVKEDWKIYPGHGESTTVFKEQKNLPMWLNMI
jgi:glyoxylase-like metal-dependent hydrolase (beta-lactamase superfamily II)